jgi:hypothetical protein
MKSVFPTYHSSLTVQLTEKRKNQGKKIIDYSAQKKTEANSRTKQIHPSALLLSVF